MTAAAAAVNALTRLGPRLRVWLATAPWRDRTQVPRLGLLALSCYMAPRTLFDAATRYQQDAVISYWTFRIGPDLYSKPAFAYAAHEYPPIFAQLVAPVIALPWEAFVLLWLVLQLGILLWLVGPRWLGLVLMLSPIQEAIWSGNLTFIYAGVAVLALRYPAAWVIPLVTKVTPGVGIIWYAVRREWRHLAIVVGLTGALVAISLVTVPDTWAAWFDWVRANGSAVGPQGLVNAVPLPLWLRLAGCAAIVTWGALRNQPWVLIVPLWLAQPTAWWTDLVMLATPLTPWLRRQG